MGHHHRQHNTFNCEINTRPKQGPAAARLDRERLRATRHMSSVRCVQKRVRISNGIRLCMIKICRYVRPILIESFVLAHLLLWNDNTLADTACYAQSDCSNTSEFCGWTDCIDEYGRLYRCAVCTSCTMCVCDFDSVDGACPRSRCPDQPSSAVRFLQGSFYNQTTALMPPGFACMRALAFSGTAFSDIQVDVPHAAESKRHGFARP